MHLPTLQAMVDLYGVCMGLTLDAEHFLYQAESLKRLSINAEILACRAGNQGAVFQTLAREISRLTAQVTNVVGELREQSRLVSIKTIRGAAAARMCDKYQLSITKGVQGGTLHAIEERLFHVGSTLVGDVGGIHSSLKRSDLSLRDIARLHVQIPVIATLLNIEANREADVDQAIVANAKSLMVLKEELANVLEKVQQKTAKTLLLLGNMG